MSRHFADITCTPGVRDAQQRYLGAPLPTPAGNPEATLGERERSFIAARDSAYLATVSETGWPHVQHRGGPRGFLRVIDARTVAFADYGGNRQFVSVGNLIGQPRAALILMDYPNRRRLKLLAEVQVLPADAADPDLVAAVTLPGAPPTERVMVLHVAAFDWNCSQHITPRYSATELAEPDSLPKP